MGREKFEELAVNSLKDFLLETNEPGADWGEGSGVRDFRDVCLRGDHYVANVIGRDYDLRYPG